MNERGVKNDEWFHPSLKKDGYNIIDEKLIIEVIESDKEDKS